MPKRIDEYKRVSGEFDAYCEETLASSERRKAESLDSGGCSGGRGGGSSWHCSWSGPGRTFSRLCLSVHQQR